MIKSSQLEKQLKHRELIKSRMALVIYSLSAPFIIFLLFSEPLLYSTKIAGFISISQIISLIIVLIGPLIALNYWYKMQSYKYITAAYEAQSFIFGYRTKTKLYGIIKEEEEISINEIANILRIKPKELRDLLYEIMGEGKIEGEFKDQNIFTITSNPEHLLKILDKKFEEWNKLGLMKKM